MRKLLIALFVLLFVVQSITRTTQEFYVPKVDTLETVREEADKLRKKRR